ncbi:hypothetical protein V8E53_000993, partial [Lactarius tabidus]
LLLVAQPDLSLPTAGGHGENQIIQVLDTDVTSIISEAATPGHQRLPPPPAVHFACHGSLEACEPFEAGFEPFRDERLTILEIVGSHLPAAEFAFQSACHTVELTEGIIMDEGLHLAAAVQYCGFRSVVGTRWVIV